MDLRAELGRAAEGAIAADDEKDIDLHFLEQVHHFGGVLRSARGAEDGSAENVDRVDGVRLKHHGHVPEAWNEPLVAEAKPVDAGGAVAQGEGAHEAADDVV